MSGASFLATSNILLTIAAAALRRIAVTTAGVAAAAGDSLSVKAVRQAVQAATGWCLDAANLRAVVKATCAEFLQQQQQQGGEQQQQQQEGVSDAAVTKAVRKLLRKGGSSWHLRSFLIIQHV
jgi:hypothetical protein